jgi:hypothetical protein
MHSENDYQKGNTINAHVQSTRNLFYHVQTQVKSTFVIGYE